MKRITITEPGGIKHEGQFFHGPIFDEEGNEITPGDTITHKDGQYFQDLGWAKCAVTGETGDRIEGVSKIKPDNILQVI